MYLLCIAAFSSSQSLYLQSSDEFLAHARHMDRRWERMLHQQQAQNQELQKNMVALASQMKRLEEEAMKKLRVKEPYSMLPPPIQVSRTLSSAEATTVGSSAAGGEVTSKGGEEGRKGKEERENGTADGAIADVSRIGAVKRDTDISYGKFRIMYQQWNPSVKIHVLLRTGVLWNTYPIHLHYPVHV